MQLKPPIAGALMAGLWLVIGQTQAAAADNRQQVNGVVRSAYFSDSCKQKVEAFGITPSPNAKALFSAFARYLAIANTPDSRAEFLAGQQMSGSRTDDCASLTVLLINLFRSNDIDAELAFVSMQSTKSADTSSAPADRLIAYVPAFDRYFDPATPVGEKSALDRDIRHAARTHIKGPSLSARAHDACRDVCMRAFAGLNDPYVVRVKTEAMRLR